MTETTDVDLRHAMDAMAMCYAISCISKMYF